MKNFCIPTFYYFYKQNSADQPGVTQEELHSSGNHGPAELTAADEGAELATRFLMETDCE